jgi:hypothetical protein
MTQFFVTKRPLTVTILTITVMLGLGIGFRPLAKNLSLTCGELDQLAANNLVAQGYAEQEAKALLGYARQRALGWPCSPDSSASDIQATAAVLKATAVALEDTEMTLAARQQAVKALTTEQLEVIRVAWESAWADAQRRASSEAIWIQVLFTVIQLLGGWLIGQFLTIETLRRWLKGRRDSPPPQAPKGDAMPP